MSKPIEELNTRYQCTHMNTSSTLQQKLLRKPIAQVQLQLLSSGVYKHCTGPSKEYDIRQASLRLAHP
jgi:hypothetical protein